jgi:hypothetical protein
MNPTARPADEVWLRSRFAEPRPIAPIATGDGHLWRSAEEIRPAAVLVPVVRREEGLTVSYEPPAPSRPCGPSASPGPLSLQMQAPRHCAARGAEEIGLAQVEVLGAV